MRLPVSLPARIGAVAAAVVIAAIGSSTAASAAVAAPPAHPQQPRHQLGHTAGKYDHQRSASPSASASASPSASPSGSPSAAPAKIVTELSIGVTRQVAHKHQITAVVFGRLFVPSGSDHGVRGKVVWLLRQGANGHWFVAGRQFTGPHGGVAFGVHVFNSANFELVFRGTPRFTAATSATTTIS
jgi:hypothetical protein